MKMFEILFVLHPTKQRARIRENAIELINDCYKSKNN